MKPIKVLYANRCPGEFWSIEELFSSVRAAVPDWIQIESVDAPQRRATLPALLANLRWARSLEGYEVFHQTGDIHYSILGVRRAPVVLTMHDLRFVDEATGIKRGLFKLLWLRLPCRRANRITVISEFTRQRLLALCPWAGAKVHVIPNCVSPEFTSSPKGWPNACKVQLLQVGTTDNKNLTRVVEACAGLDVKLLVLGKLNDAQCDHMKRCGLDYENFVNLTRSQVMDLYVRADLIVFVSTYEGFGLPILEAQAVGRPVLTSDVPPLRDVAGDSAVLVDPLNVGDIRNGLLRLLEDSELRGRMVAAGFRNVRRYSPSAVALQYANLYREVFEESRFGSARIA